MKKLKIKVLPSEHFDDRIEGAVIDTLIIHSMHDPEAEDCFSLHSCKTCLDRHTVSVHYIIDLDGQVWQLVPEEKCAWHAGPSKMPATADGRERVNQFSIGIELVGSEDTDFAEAQYRSLVLLTVEIMTRHNITNILGHADIAPDRKTDPWGFDWKRFRKDTLAFAKAGTQIKFPPNALT
ncbi:N-acetylmuramoyl-L-alanine amidase [Oligoflexia bacterium]|nr:N-acetylmuramoyl-L-alanine amidase [Oligoflexia bacterium]